MKPKILSITAITIGLLLISIQHLGYSFGDDLFRWIGISPWTHADTNTGLHLPVVAGLVLLFLGVGGVSRIYRDRYPKIMSRVIAGCIAFIMMFPFVSEGFMFLVKYNSSGISSVSYAKKDSQCDYRLESERVRAECRLTIYNYGTAQQVMVRPLLMDYGEVAIAFEPRAVAVQPRSQTRVHEVFDGYVEQQSTSTLSIRTVEKEPGMEFTVNGRSKEVK